LVEQLIVTEPIEILEKNRTEVHPDSSMLLDQVNTQDVGLFVDCLSVAFADDLLKVIVIWKVIFNVPVSYEMKLPSIPFCGLL
jgi:hypothetical protein